jgi:hypothetical protein
VATYLDSYSIPTRGLAREDKERAPVVTEAIAMTGTAARRDFDLDSVPSKNSIELNPLIFGILREFMGECCPEEYSSWPPVIETLYQ